MGSVLSCTTVSLYRECIASDDRVIGELEIIWKEQWWPNEGSFLEGLRNTAKHRN
jgi:hypothetical protein